VIERVLPIIKYGMASLEVGSEFALNKKSVCAGRPAKLEKSEHFTS